MNKTFLQWLTQDYLSTDAIVAAYEKELQKRYTGMTHALVSQLKDSLSPCKNCGSYATCHRTGAQKCQKVAQINDAIVQAVEATIRPLLEENNRSLTELKESSSDKG